MLSHVGLFATPWTTAYQAPLSMGFPRQQYWRELPWSTAWDLPDLGIEFISPASPALQVDSLAQSYRGSPLLAWTYSLTEGHHRWEAVSWFCFLSSCSQFAMTHTHRTGLGAMGRHIKYVWQPIPSSIWQYFEKQNFYLEKVRGWCLMVINRV